MKICILDGHIVGYSQNCGTEVSAERWGEIQTALKARPVPEEGTQAMLRADTLEWEFVPMPDGEDEKEHDPSAEELLNILLGGDGA